MVEPDNLRVRMRGVLESVRAEDAIQLPEGEPFLVLNPGYHDGERASFLFLPTPFCEATLLRPRGVRRQDVWAPPLGRLLTVTDRGIVLTITAAQKRMIHVTCDVTDEFRNLDGMVTTMGSLDDAARSMGWLVPWVDFDAVMTDVARYLHLTTSYSQLLKLPSGTMKSDGGES
jgi:hypothetical protein